MTTDTLAQSLFVVADLGSSQTRVLWSLAGDDTIDYRLFSADCALASGAQERFNSLGTESFLVRFGRNSFVTGLQAADNPLAADTIDEMKVEGAIPKILAAMHVALEATGLTQPLLTLVVLLPAVEHQSSSLLESSLQKYARKFECNGRSHQLKFEQLCCLPEGVGVLRYMASLFDRWQQENILTIMAGYRDLSMLTSRGFKDIFKARTARLGLLWLLKDIEEQIGHIDRMETARVLYEFGWKPITVEDCLPLTRVMSSHMKVDDARLIAKAIKVSRRKYREYIEKILRSISFSYEILLVAGGTGDFLAQAIVEELGTSTLFQPDPLINRIIKEYGFERAEAVRLADIFAIAFMHKSAVRAVA
ncbi:MAG: hypothetical protein AAGM36_18885 [Cyanobacteria bacterium J06597_1]